MYIYLASSWSNQMFEFLHSSLSKMEGTKVYNFRDPENYFTWEQVDENWKEWGIPEFNEQRDHPAMVKGYNRDYQALLRCDLLVLLLPCGKDSHLEAGWAIGQGKPVIFFAPGSFGFEPGLMYKLSDLPMVDTLPGLKAAIRLEAVKLWAREVSV